MYYFHIQLNAVLLSFQRILKKKMYHVVVAVFNIANTKKCYLSIKPAY